MAKNLWDKERNEIFRDLVRQYEEEGYSLKDSKKLAKTEVDEVMLDKENVLEYFLSDDLFE
jgi:hypothetical protein|tara:strand:+ start:746 stop:928 length:183 start_codon:yes stop_codon:yes gene_type:complete